MLSFASIPVHSIATNRQIKVYMPIEYANHHWIWHDILQECMSIQTGQVLSKMSQLIPKFISESSVIYNDPFVMEL